MKTKPRKPPKLKPFAVIDSETPPFVFGRTDLEPFIWGFYDGENYERFDTTEELVRYISDLDIIIYAHNGGKFDYHFLAPFFEPNQPIMLINGRIAKLKLGNCELRDSFNIIPVGLAQFEKQKIDYSLFEKETRDIPYVRKMIEDYLYSDCVNLYRIVETFRARHGNALTLAGASLKLLRQICEIDQIKTTLEYFEEMRPFYYGGRVQCFQKGVIEKPFSVYDINSAYPFAMRENHWFSDRITYCKKPIEYANEKPQAFFDITCVSKGALPFRDKVGGKLLFPSDDIPRRYLVSGWEIKTALKHNCLSDITVHLVYDCRETRDFAAYVDTIYALRMQAKESGDEAYSLIHKLELNSPYGKLGADCRSYTRAVLFDSKHMADLSLDGLHYKSGQITENDNDPLYTLAGSLGECLVGARPLHEHEMHFYNVATAASITGFVRAYLFDAIMTTGVDNVLYCDTDSIATESGAGLDCGKKLGQWKHEGDFWQAAIAGRKMYAFFPSICAFPPVREDGAIVDTGAAKSASKGVQLTAEEILNLARGVGITFAKDAPCFSVRFGQRYISRKIVATG